MPSSSIWKRCDGYFRNRLFPPLYGLHRSTQEPANKMHRSYPRHHAREGSNYRDESHAFRSEELRHEFKSTCGWCDFACITSKRLTRRFVRKLSLERWRKTLIWFRSRRRWLLVFVTSLAEFELSSNYWPRYTGKTWLKRVHYWVVACAMSFCWKTASFNVVWKNA